MFESLDHICDLCDKKFDSQNIFTKNRKWYHDGQRQSLKRHIQTVHENFKGHKCSICDKAFYEKRYLKNHINSVHHDVMGDLDKSSDLEDLEVTSIKKEGLPQWTWLFKIQFAHKVK